MTVIMGLMFAGIFVGTMMMVAGFYINRRQKSYDDDLRGR